MADASQFKLDQRMMIGTDIASIYLYHPNDLKHRETSPIDWPNYHFACGPEFAAGRLVAFSTGSDGGYAIRATSDPLSERERKWLCGSWDFRLAVLYGRVYFDGGYSVPSDDYRADWEDYPESWIELPNGSYKVTVHAIEWSSEPGALDDEGNATESALTNYVVQFTMVDDLRTIPSSTLMPQLECSRECPPSEGYDFADPFDEAEVELADRYVMLVDPLNVPVPGFQVKLEVSSEFYKAVFGASGNQALPDRITSLVIATSDQPPCLGAIVKPSGASREGRNPWVMSFDVKRLVTVNTMEAGDSEWSHGQVEFLKRAPAEVDLSQVKQLKDAFAAYAKANSDYRAKIENPDFEAERIEAMNQTAGLLNLLIHHVQMPRERRIELLKLSDADRAKRLLTIMEGN